MKKTSTHHVTVKRDIVLTGENIDDIMTTALEGGINYWCCKAEVVENEYYGEYASEQISRGGSLRLYDSEDDEVYILTLDKFLRGFKMACENDYPPIWLEGNEVECSYIDACEADTIVQYAVFGELVYG